MKRVLLFLLVAVLATPAFAQIVQPQFVPTSLENGITMGLFTNEFDQSFQADPNFGQFAKSFLFAGLGNPTAGLGTFNSEGAFAPTYTAPLKFGYYMPGKMPLSLYSSMDFTTLALRAIPSTTTTPTYGAPVAVTSGTTTTTYNWVANSLVFTPSDVVFARTMRVDAQALTKLGPATVGLYLLFNANNTSSDVVGAEANFGQNVQTFNVNTGGAGVPVTTQNYTVTETLKNVATGAPPAVGTSGLYTFVDTYRLGVPFAMKTGNLEHRASLQATLTVNDRPAAYSLVQSAHTQTAGLASNPDDTLAVTSNTTNFNVTGSYELRIPAGAAGNEWRANALVLFGLEGQAYSFDDVIRPYNLSVVGSKTALTGGTHTVQTDTYSPGLDIGAVLTGSRVVSLQPAQGMVFMFSPAVVLGAVRTSNGATLTGSTAYVAPLDATGAVNQTVAYNTTTTAVSGAPAGNFIVITGAALPMGLTVMPSDWKFGIILGANPSAMALVTAATSSGETTTTTVVNTTGSTTNSTNISSAINTPNTTTTVTYSFSEEHFIGITVPFANGVHFDARLNGSLLNFESFTIQAFIPIG